MGIAHLNVCVVFVVSYFILYYFVFLSSLSIFWIFQTFWLFLSSILRFIHGKSSFFHEIHKIRGFMVQSLDLVRISTVQSTDFTGQSSDLVEDLSKSSSGSEEFIYFVWVSVWHLDRLPFTQPLDCPTVTADGVSEISSQKTVQIWAQIGLGRKSVCVDLFLNFLLYSSSHHEILHIFGVKSLDFLVNPWVNPQIVWISLNPWIYWIYLRIFNFSLILLPIFLSIQLQLHYKSKSSVFLLDFKLKLS